MATANGTRFVSAQSMVHFSGQLTTFDAEYTLSGPGIHFLAELHAHSGFAILDRDIGALRNQVIALGEHPDMPSTLDGFVEVLTATFPPVPATVPPEILTAVQQIEAADGAISISQLADELGMNDRVFRRQFSRIVGMSPKSFAVCQRIIAALKLMAMNPDKSIVDVGYEAGFADQSHLTNTFKQYMRTTPAKLELDTDGVLRSIVAQM